jgi:two-component system, NarL family, invasion response regulator UvrY
LAATVKSKISQAPPDRMGWSGLEAMRRMLLYDEDARVLIFSMHGDAIFVKRALQTGAFGYVTKASAPNVFARGKKYLSPEVAQSLALGEGVAFSQGLTQREFDVLRLIILGQTVKEIAEAALGLNSKSSIVVSAPSFCLRAD